MKKDEIRKKYIEIRKNIKFKKIKSYIIFLKIKNMDLYKKSNVIALYNSTSNEVNTKRLINYSLKKKKIVLLPVVVGKEIIFYKINKKTKYIKSKFGVFEPITDIKDKLDPNVIDLIIVPGICFDYEGNRIGFGKGYYDRFLQNKNLNTIGICFDEQIIDKVEIEKTDISMDNLVTDKRNIRIK